MHGLLRARQPAAAAAFRPAFPDMAAAPRRARQTRRARARTGAGAGAGGDAAVPRARTRAPTSTRTGAGGGLGCAGHGDTPASAAAVTAPHGGRRCPARRALAPASTRQVPWDAESFRFLLLVVKPLTLSPQKQKLFLTRPAAGGRPGTRGVRRSPTAAPGSTSGARACSAACAPRARHGWAPGTLRMRRPRPLSAQRRQPSQPRTRRSRAGARAAPPQRAYRARAATGAQTRAVSAVESRRVCARRAPSRMQRAPGQVRVPPSRATAASEERPGRVATSRRNELSYRLLPPLAPSESFLHNNQSSKHSPSLLTSRLLVAGGDDSGPVPRLPSDSIHTARVPKLLQLL